MVNSFNIAFMLGLSRPHECLVTIFFCYFIRKDTAKISIRLH